MPKIAGFHCEIDRPDAPGAPLVLLHGGGQDENAWSDVTESLAPASPAVRLRGNIAWQGNHAFFRRHPDRRLDLDDLARSVKELELFVGSLAAHLPDRPPVLVGYSNGAIVAAALASRAMVRTRGAILMRPLSPNSASAFPPLPGYPVLLLAGRDDDRRAPEDSTILADQFNAAGAAVSHHVLPCGHGWDEHGRDIVLTREWLKRFPPIAPSTAAVQDRPRHST